MFIWGLITPNHYTYMNVLSKVVNKLNGQFGKEINLFKQYISRAWDDINEIDWEDDIIQELDDSEFEFVDTLIENNVNNYKLFVKELKKVLRTVEMTNLD